MSGANFVISREDWSLHRKGEIDRQRHREKVREAIKKNLA
ncbi:MAG: sporulation protein YhbH, partial [Desulfotomaculaceae bacterium]|nr:sporulation protein YhbH [Desulfotomaculaceae bacterium]